jgi:hypothetical protein
MFFVQQNTNMKAGGKQSTRQQSILLATCFYAGILLCLFIHKEWSDMFLHKVG